MKVSSHRGAVSQPDSERRQPDDERVVALHRATLTAIDFRRARFDRFSIGSCLFDRCDFRGLTIDRRLAPLFHAAPRSVFRDCYFDGADARRARLGQTRFERCTFDDARLEGAHAEAAEFIDCRFAGRLDAVTFSGTPSGPEAKRLDPRRMRNEFRGNDFRDAEMLDAPLLAGSAPGMLTALAVRWRDQDVVVARRWTPRIKASDRLQARVWDLLERI